MSLNNIDWNKVEIYTDGASKGNPGSAASAMVVYNDSKLVYGLSIPLGLATNNQAEMVAVLTALEAVEWSKTTCPVPIYTDSAYICNCFEQKWYVKWRQNGWKNSKKQPVANSDLWKQMLEKKEKTNAVILKVKGHSGVAGNEMADKLASEAAETQEGKVI